MLFFHCTGNGCCRLKSPRVFFKGFLLFSIFFLSTQFTLSAEAINLSSLASQDSQKSTLRDPYAKNEIFSDEVNRDHDNQPGLFASSNLRLTTELVRRLLSKASRQNSNSMAMMLHRLDKENNAANREKYPRFVAGGGTKDVGTGEERDGNLLRLDRDYYGWLDFRKRSVDEEDYMY